MYMYIYIYIYIERERESIQKHAMKSTTCGVNELIDMYVLWLPHYY